MHRAVQLALDIYGEELGPAGVTLRQYAVLCAVSADEGLSQTGLVHATGIDRSTLADMVARMIAKELLVRERSITDARANTVRLSDAGRQALEIARPHVAAADHRLLSFLGAKKRDPFVAALRRLSRASEKALAPELSDAAAPADGDEAALRSKPKKRPKGDGAGKKKQKSKRRRELEGETTDVRPDSPDTRPDHEGDGEGVGGGP